MTRKPAKKKTSLEAPPFPGDIRFPGITPGRDEIGGLLKELPHRLNALKYKAANGCLWAMVIGGTGTGKSTLFNLFCGRNLSMTGVERPKTLGPLAFAHEGCRVEQDFPFPDLAPEKIPESDEQALPTSGGPGILTVVEHRDKNLAGVVVVDTPDLDSIEEHNRKSALRLALLADAVIFVTSQEKYADEVPSRLLRGILEEGAVAYFILNKADKGFDEKDAARMAQNAGIDLKEERLWVVPRVSSNSFQEIAGHPGFQAFKERFSGDFSAGTANRRQGDWLARNADSTQSRLQTLKQLLEAEKTALDSWSGELEAVFREASEELIRLEGEQFAAGRKSHIQKEIRGLFSRYDLLAGPRRALGNVIRVPFRLLGSALGVSRGKDPASVEKARKAADPAPVLEVLARADRKVLENLAGANEASPLFHAVRQPGIAMEPGAVESRLSTEQENLEIWLKDRFDEMARGLPLIKKWSIYSTSVIWGVLILALEATLGGGFTMIDALLDSALAPLVTKGSAELFAFQEIRKLAREMAQRYRQGLLSIIREQQAKYEKAAEPFHISFEDLEKLELIALEVLQLKNQAKGK